MRAGSQNRRPGAEERLAPPGIVWPCRSLPFGTSRTGSTGPSLPPAGAVSLSPGDHLRTDTGGEWNSRHRARVCSSWAIEEESNMPVLLLWAGPPVTVVGATGSDLVWP